MHTMEHQPQPTLKATPTSFYKELKTEVSEFLLQNNIPQKQSNRMLLKAVFLFTLWAATYVAFLILGQVHGAWALGLSVLWALSMLPIQMAVMHDASHGASNENQNINELLCLSISFLGGSSLLWKKQHCQAHHSFTNIHGLDHDIHTGGILRLHPSQPLKPTHRYQQYYAWALYPLFVLSWIWWGDMRDLIDNTYSMSKKQLRAALIETVIIKVWHVLLFLALPAFLFQSLGLALACYLISFSILGLVMVVIFQMAHITGNQSLANSVEELGDDWAIRQLLTTANFSTNNSFLTWYIGGLNYQIEHHIFPSMSHINYPKIQKLVIDKCKKHGIPYLSFSSVRETIAAHQQHLRELGVPNALDLSHNRAK